MLFRVEALEQMVSHARDGEPLEVIGALLGFPGTDALSNQPVTYVETIVPYQADATRTYVSMQLSSYADLDEARKRTDTLQVGYYHSHPGHGVFQSGVDVANFIEYHPEPYQLAVVVDTTRQSAGLESLDPSWIGTFVWASEKRPVRMPARDVHLTRTRPAVVTAHDGPEDPGHPAAQSVDAQSSTSRAQARDSTSRAKRWRASLRGFIRKLERRFDDRPPA